MTSPLGFKVKVGSALFAIFCGGECNVHSPRFNILIQSSVFLLLSLNDNCSAASKFIQSVLTEFPLKSLVRSIRSVRFVGLIIFREISI